MSLPLKVFGWIYNSDDDHHLPVFFFLTFLAVALSSSINFSGNFAPFALRRKASICWEFNGSIGFDCGIWPSISDLNYRVGVNSIVAILLPVSQNQSKKRFTRNFTWVKSHYRMVPYWLFLANVGENVSVNLWLSFGSIYNVHDSIRVRLEDFSLLCHSSLEGAVCP